MCVCVCVCVLMTLDVMKQDYGCGCGFAGSVPLSSCRLGGRESGEAPGGLVTNWKALPEDGLAS